MLGCSSMQRLSDRQHTVYSQHGEEGVVEAILGIIDSVEAPQPLRWCVEFGAGRNNNNTRLFIERGFRAVLIEANPVFYTDLANSYAGNSAVTCLERIVSWQGDNALDRILSETPVPAKFDFLVVDVDGNDAHIFSALENYRPKLVMIEFNASFPANVSFVQPRSESVRWGSSLKGVTDVAKSKGYELVAVLKGNAFFVDARYFDAFAIKDNAPHALSDDTSQRTWSQFYDGTIVLHAEKPSDVLAFKHKAERSPVYVMANNELVALDVRRESSFVRYMKNAFKRTPLFPLFYGFISGYYGGKWKATREKLDARARGKLS